MAEQKYVGVQAGVGIIKLRVGSEEVELTASEVRRVKDALVLAAFRAKMKNM